MMFAVFITVVLLTVCTNSCSIAYPQQSILYISNVQLLSDTSYSDSVLLTIQRSSAMTAQTFNVRPRLSYFNNGPWCKIMNVNDGSVSDTVTCSAYTTREFSQPDTDPKSTTVTCNDNCDGKTATCVIVRDGISYTINDIPYLGSTNCHVPLVYFGSMSSSFTINDISTTYISFSTNMVAIQFNDNVSPAPVTYQIYNVEKRGDWSYLTPGQYGIDSKPIVYSEANVIRVALPCCLCYGSRLSFYDIATDTNTMTQIFTMKSLGFGGGSVDVVKQRVFNWGLYFSQSLTVYDVLHEGASGSDVFRPHLCGSVVYCYVPPCDDPGLSCPYNKNARCVNDYCGGCNARWFCGASDITTFCDSGQTSTQICESMVVHKTTVLR